MSVQRWCLDRVPTDLLHLDVAACGRVSRAVLDAQSDHLLSEAREGGYVAEVAAGPALEAGRAALASMVGLAGPDLFWAESAVGAMTALLDAWPLGAGARIGTLPGEYAGYASLLRQRALLHGWELVLLPVDDLGRITDVPTGLDLVVVDHVASQRGVVQPDLTGEGVPVVVDGAQAFGQTELPTGAAAYVGTSRKWLCGPRGVGFAVVDPAWQGGLRDPSRMLQPEVGFPWWLDGLEAHVAGRVGLAQAARTWSPALLPVVHAAAAAARVLLEGAGGWRVVEPVDQPTGITTLVPPAGVDPFAVRLRLLDEGVLVSAVPQSRADDLAGPLLRVSTAAWVTPGDLERLADALPWCSGN